MEKMQVWLLKQFELKDIYLNNISCDGEHCCWKIAQWGSQWNFENKAFLNIYNYMGKNIFFDLYKKSRNFWCALSYAKDGISLSSFVQKIWAFENCRNGLILREILGYPPN